MINFSKSRYETYKNLFTGCRYPLAFVDLDQFDKNISYVAGTQEKTGKTIRVASKSIRCLDLIKRIFEKEKTAYQGILAFSSEEAGFLIDKGFDDIIVAYPSVQPGDIDILVDRTKKGAALSMMIDCSEHLTALSRAGETAGIVLNACLDIDMSFRPFGDAAHIGVRRSPVHTLEQAVQLAGESGKLPGVRINSIMGYEAQIASVNDNYPGRPVKNAILRFVKGKSITELTDRRRKIVTALKSAGLNLSVVNGGGSGSLVSTGADKTVTEVTAGSAFYAPGLFRYFNDVRFKPSAFFALQVTRKPTRHMITCHGGGYVGSGEVNVNKLPWPVMPKGLSYLSIEGAGEVQTPLRLAKGSPDIKIGDPVFFQHAKAGELCERFNQLYLVQNRQIINCVSTYRGEGKAFL